MPRTTIPDILAGLSIAGLLLPEAVAYSSIAGLPPQAGVVALFAGLACYGVLGRSRYAIVTATSSSAAVLASATLALGASSVTERVTLAALLVIGAGSIFMLCGVLRLGAISQLIARPVLRGYTFGLALVIAVRQWPHMVNLHSDNRGFFTLIFQLLRDYHSWQLPSLACGLSALAGLYLLERFRRVPGALVVIVASILAAPPFAAHGVVLTGPIDLTLTMPAFAVPAGTLLMQLIEFSFAIMLILYAESYGSIRTFALRHDEAVQLNRELFALGVANVVSGLARGTPVGAGYSATSANEAAGAESRLAGLSAAAVVLVLVLAFLGWIERIPEPALAAIVIHAVSKSLRLSAFRNYFVWKTDRLVALAAVLGVIVLGVLYGLLGAIALSILLLLRSLAQPRLSVLGRLGAHDYLDTTLFPAAATVPDILVLRLEEPLLFFNADPLMTAVRGRVRAAPAARILVLSLEESPDLDSTSLEALGELCSWLAARGVELRFARLKAAARGGLLRANLKHASPRALDYASVDDAVRGECMSS
jgi:MFS superfamily sulfate permease-like transporter